MDGQFSGNEHVNDGLSLGSNINNNPTLTPNSGAPNGSNNLYNTQDLALLLSQALQNNPPTNSALDAQKMVELQKILLGNQTNNNQVNNSIQQTFNNSQQPSLNFGLNNNSNMLLGMMMNYQNMLNNQGNMGSTSPGNEVNQSVNNETPNPLFNGVQNYQNNLNSMPNIAAQNALMNNYFQFLQAMNGMPVSNNSEKKEEEKPKDRHIPNTLEKDVLPSESENNVIDNDLSEEDIDNSRDSVTSVFDLGYNPKIASGTFKSNDLNSGPIRRKSSLKSSTPQQRLSSAKASVSLMPQTKEDKSEETKDKDSSTKANNNINFDPNMLQALLQGSNSNIPLNNGLDKDTIAKILEVLNSQQQANSSNTSDKNVDLHAENKKDVLPEGMDDDVKTIDEIIDSQNNNKNETNKAETKLENEEKMLDDDSEIPALHSETIIIPKEKDESIEIPLRNDSSKQEKVEKSLEEVDLSSLSKVDLSNSVKKEEIDDIPLFTSNNSLQNKPVDQKDETHTDEPSSSDLNNKSMVANAFRNASGDVRVDIPTEPVNPFGGNTSVIPDKDKIDKVTVESKEAAKTLDNNVTSQDKPIIEKHNIPKNDDIPFDVGNNSRLADRENTTALQNTPVSRPMPGQNTPGGQAVASPVPGNTPVVPNGPTNRPMPGQNMNGGQTVASPVPGNTPVVPNGPTNRPILGQNIPGGQAVASPVAGNTPVVPNGPANRPILGQNMNGGQPVASPVQGNTPVVPNGPTNRPMPGQNMNGGQGVASPVPGNTPVVPNGPTNTPVQGQNMNGGQGVASPVPGNTPVVPNGPTNRPMPGQNMNGGQGVASPVPGNTPVVPNGPTNRPVQGQNIPGGQAVASPVAGNTPVVPNGPTNRPILGQNIPGGQAVASPVTGNAPVVPNGPTNRPVPGQNMNGGQPVARPVPGNTPVVPSGPASRPVSGQNMNGGQTVARPVPGNTPVVPNGPASRPMSGQNMNGGQGVAIPVPGNKSVVPSAPANRPIPGQNMNGGQPVASPVPGNTPVVPNGPTNRPVLGQNMNGGQPVASPVPGNTPVVPNAPVNRPITGPDMANKSAVTSPVPENKPVVPSAPANRPIPGPDMANKSAVASPVPENKPVVPSAPVNRPIPGPEMANKGDASIAPAKRPIPGPELGTKTISQTGNGNNSTNGRSTVSVPTKKVVTNTTKFVSQQTTGTSNNQTSSTNGQGNTVRRIVRSGKSGQAAQNASNSDQLKSGQKVIKMTNGKMTKRNNDDELFDAESNNGKISITIPGINLKLPEIPIKLFVMIVSFIAIVITLLIVFIVITIINKKDGYELFDGDSIHKYAAISTAYEKEDFKSTISDFDPSNLDSNNSFILIYDKMDDSSSTATWILYNYKTQKKYDTGVDDPLVKSSDENVMLRSMFVYDSSGQNLIAVMFNTKSSLDSGSYIYKAHVITAKDIEDHSDGDLKNHATYENHVLDKYSYNKVYLDKNCFTVKNAVTTRNNEGVYSAIYKYNDYNTVVLTTNNNPLLRFAVLDIPDANISIPIMAEYSGDVEKDTTTIGKNTKIRVIAYTDDGTSFITKNTYVPQSISNYLIDKDNSNNNLYLFNFGNNSYSICYLENGIKCSSTEVTNINLKKDIEVSNVLGVFDGSDKVITDADFYKDDVNSTNNLYALVTYKSGGIYFGKIGDSDSFQRVTVDKIEDFTGVSVDYTLVSDYRNDEDNSFKIGLNTNKKNYILTIKLNDGEYSFELTEEK